MFATFVILVHFLSPIFPTGGGATSQSYDTAADCAAALAASGLVASTSSYTATCITQAPVTPGLPMPLRRHQ